MISSKLFPGRAAHFSRAQALVAAAAAVLGTACDSNNNNQNPSDNTAPGFSAPPLLTPNPNPAAPLAARLTLTTDEAAEIELVIDDGVGTWRVTPEPGFRMVHDLAVLGVRADRTHIITIEAFDSAGNRGIAGPVTFQTPPLPAKFPPIVFDQTVHDPARMEPGVTLLNVRTADPAITGGTWGMLLALDPSGEPIWFYRADHEINDVRRLANGNLLYNYNRRGIVEIDMFGDIQGAWWPDNLDPLPAGHTAVATDTFHHEVIEMPAGTVGFAGSSAGAFASLSSELRPLPNYPLSEIDPNVTNPVDTNVIGDVVVEFRRDGSIVGEWRLLDILDPFRLGYGSLGSFWDTAYGVPTADWSHANAVVYDASDDTWIVSVRAQDAIVKFERQTGAIVWILGPPENWIPPFTSYLFDPGADDPVQLNLGAQPFEWTYHTHAPELLAGGDILVFDNGNGRASPPAIELPVTSRYSRAVRMTLDTTAKTATQVWSYGHAGDPWYSGFLGDADLMPTTNNVLITDGGKNDGVQLTGRVLEVTQDIVPEVVFEFELREANPGNNIGWTIYRSERLPSIYP